MFLIIFSKGKSSTTYVTNVHSCDARSIHFKAKKEEHTKVCSLLLQLEERFTLQSMMELVLHNLYLVVKITTVLRVYCLKMIDKKLVEDLTKMADQFNYLAKHFRKVRDFVKGDASKRFCLRLY